MGGETALVFDDDNFFRTLLADTLADLGVEVTSYSTHAEFLARLQEGTAAVELFPDYILTDNQMPEMTGIEFFAHLKEIGYRLPDHRLAIISGRWDDADLERAGNLGCRTFQKYNSPDQISAWIKEVRGR
jgi:CheY-like chemotaxis protein